MATTVSSLGTVSSGTGRPSQNHLVYAANDAAWWLFGVTSSDTTHLQCWRSTDLVTWTAGAALTLTSGATHQSEACNFAVAYKNISSTDVFHVVRSWKDGAGSASKSFETRATVSGGAITWGTEAALFSTSGTSLSTPDSPNVTVGSDGFVWTQSDYDNVGSDSGEPASRKSTNADAGTSWTSGFGTAAVMDGGVTAATVNSRALLPQASGNVLAVWDSGSATTTYTNVRWRKSASGAFTSGTTAANALAANVTAQLKNDWSACRVSDTAVYLVSRSATNAFVFRLFNGTSWSTPTNLPGGMTTGPKAGAGVVLQTDGTDLWLWAVENDAANTLRYNAYTVASGTWGGWTAAETSTQTRNWLGGYQAAGNSTLGVYWTQTNGSNFDLVVSSLSLGGGGTAFTSSLSGSVTPSGALARQAGKALAGSASAAGALARSALRALAGSAAPAGALARSALKSLAGSATPSGAAVARSALKALSGSAAAAGSLARSLARPLTGSAAAAGSLSRSTLRPLAGSASAAGALARGLARTLAGSTTPAGALSTVKAFLRSLSGSAAPAGALARRAGKAPAGSAAPAGSLARSAARGLAGSAAAAGSLVKAAARALAGSAAPSGSLARVRAVLKSLAGSASAAGALARSAAKGFSGSAAPAGALARSTFRSLAGSAAAAGVLARKALKSLAGSAAASASFSAALAAGGVTAAAYYFRTFVLDRRRWK